jgi:hypothetical protein
MERISNDRLEVLASRAGGHRVGAPSTWVEERAMATELLALRQALEQAKTSTLASFVGLHGPVMHSNCRVLTIKMVDEMIDIAMTQRRTPC